MNPRITAPEVLLLGFDGKEIGIRPREEAERMAEEQGLALVLVNGLADPPVCRLLDFARFKFEALQREKASRRATPRTSIKYVQLTPTTDQHDLGLKLGQIRRFLEEGHRCVISVVLEGRQSAHPETGQAMLDQVVRSVVDLAIVEGTERREDGSMAVVLAPLPRPLP